MIDLPMKAEVQCSDGAAGRCTYVIFNPNNHRLTNLVVKSDRLPFEEYLVPLDQVEATTNDLIKLKCPRKDLYAMEPFECEQYIRTKLPEYREFPNYYPGIGINTREVDTFIPVRLWNIAPSDMAVRRGVQVEATDGTIGWVDELLINSNNMQVAYLVLLERHLLEHREVAIPVSQIKRVYDETIYLKLDRQSVEALPTRPSKAGHHRSSEAGAGVPLEGD